jgi:hypothetical protein
MSCATRSGAAPALKLSIQSANSRSDVFTAIPLISQDIREREVDKLALARLVLCHRYG